jgi:hypothetical protein
MLQLVANQRRPRSADLNAIVTSLFDLDDGMRVFDLCVRL